MRKTACLTAILFVAGLVLAPIALAADKTHEVTAQVVKVDMAGKTITIKNEKGEEMTATVLETAADSLKGVKAGDTVTLTCLDDEAGAHKGVSAIKQAKK